MNHDDVSKILKELPRQDASPAFTEQVLARLDTERPTPRRRRSWQLASAALVFAVVIIIGGGQLAREARREEQRRRAAAERVESMRAEYRELQLELERLRRLTSEAEPVIELGSSERVDFIFDMRQLAEQPGRAHYVPTSAPR